MTTKIAGRHRLAVRPRTPLTTIGEAVSANASTVGRRSAVIAASSGLMVTMGLPAAGATPLIHSAPDATSDSASAQALDGDVSAPRDAQVSFALSSLTSTSSAQSRHDSAVASAERLAAAGAVSRGDDRSATDDASASASPSASASASASASSSPSASSSATASTSAPSPSSSAPASSTPTADATPSATATASSTATATATATRTAAASRAVAPSMVGVAAVDLARRYIGIPYRYGGTTPAGFDCSGFVQYVYGQLGVDLPRTAASQSQAGTRITASQAQPGDIVSFYNSGGVFHNGIYLGNGQMINSPRTGETLKVQSIWSSSVVFTRVTT